MHCDTMRRNLLKNKKKMRISFQPVENPDKVNTHLLSWLLAACSMIAVLPIPGGPIRRIGRCLTDGRR